MPSLETVFARETKLKMSGDCFLSEKISVVLDCCQKFCIKGTEEVVRGQILRSHRRNESAIDAWFDI